MVVLWVVVVGVVIVEDTDVWRIEREVISFKVLLICVDSKLNTVIKHPGVTWRSLQDVFVQETLKEENVDTFLYNTFTLLFVYLGDFNTVPELIYNDWRFDRSGTKILPVQFRVLHRTRDFVPFKRLRIWTTNSRRSRFCTSTTCLFTVLLYNQLKRKPLSR